METTELQADETSAVQTAYESASRAYLDASAIPDPGFAALAATTTDPLLAQSRQSLRSLQLQHQVARLPSPTVSRVAVDRSSVDISGDVARLEACVVDDAQIVEAASGRVINGRVSTVLWKAALKKVSGNWLLAEQRVITRWEGEAGCAAG